jgi:LCP family protein required for cell wall assembly
MGDEADARPAPSLPSEPSSSGVGAPSVEGGRHRRPPRRSRWVTALVALSGVLAALIGVAIWAAARTANDYGNDVGRLPDALPTGERPPAAPRSMTYLVIGVDPSDDTAGAAVAESLVLVRVPGDRRGIQMVALPAGMRTGESGATLESVYGTGDTQELVGAVESETGVRIDHVAMLDFPGFQQMTDALGGVTVDVPEPYSNLGHRFPVGRQRLDGAAALAYVRNRDVMARPGAPVREQRMIQALFERASEKGLLSDLGRLTATIRSLTESISVDDTLDNPDLVSLAWDLRGVGSPDFVTAPSDDRADSLWTYLRSDSLQDHLDEFR